MTRRMCALAFVVGLFTMMLPSAAAGGGCLEDPGFEMTSSTDSRVTIARCTFLDTVTYVDAGESVTWVNQDHAPHTVTGAAGSWGDEDYLETTDKVTYAFEDEGVFPYYCALHPRMVGTVVVGVGKPPAKTGSNGVTAVDAPAAAAAPSSPSDGGGSSSALPISLGAAAAAIVAFLLYRTAQRRRTGALVS